MLQLRRRESEFLINVQDDYKRKKNIYKNIFKFTITIN